MTTIVLDTLDYANKLKAGGFTDQQAETQARALADVLEHQVITKAQAVQSETRLEARIREAELKLEAKIESTKAELIRWVVGAVFLQASLIIGVLLKVTKTI